MASLTRDLRFSLRAFRRSPLFTSVAVVSLALGIGANTAIFTLMDQLMLRELPVKQPGQLVMIYPRGPVMGSNMGDRMNSYPLYQDFQRKAAPFSEVMCRRLFDASLSVDNHTERVDGEMVSGNYFTMLGVRPAIGRVFDSAEDDRVYMGQPEVVLSYGYWASRFDHDPRIIGKKVLVNNFPMTIVGVSAAGFEGLDPSQSPQIRVPILMEPAMEPSWDWFNMTDRRVRWTQIFARMKPGYTTESAQAALQVLYHQICQYESTLPAAKNWSAYSRNIFLHSTIHVKPAATGYSHLRNSFSKALIVLMGMVGLVLLIACANVANLLIARALARSREIAVRLSIGASRGQLVRQLLVESVLLSLAGGAAGVFLAVALTRGLLAMIPTDGNPLLIRSTPDLRILLFTLALSILTGIVFGLVPALRASRQDLWTTLKQTVGSVAGSPGSLFLRKGLVSAQVALSFLLLFGAGLFVRSLEKLKDTNTGFRDIDNLVTFQISPDSNGYTDERGTQFFSDLLDRLRAAPGVKSAGIATVALLSGDEWDSSMSVEGHQAKDGEDMQAFMNSVSPGYFKTMGIPLLAGRDFTRLDIAKDARVAIVNERFAHHFFGNRSPIGRHVGWGVGPGTKLNMEIVGLVADSLFDGPREGVHRQAFIPNWGSHGVAVYVRAGLGANAMHSIIRSAVRSLDPSMPVYAMKTLEAQLDETLLSERLIALLSAGFGALATLLAAIGLYGVMAFVVARRTKEMGLRMALGAQSGAVIWLVMKEVLALVVIGLAIGVPAALWLGRFVSSQLYDVKAGDPWIAAASLAMLIGVAAVAGLIPAHRASRIDPILALRYE
jgi:putative ABC transport system permease protein